MVNYTVYRLKYYYQIPINTSGVLVTCKVYITDRSLGYDLLLSRNWIYRVGCIHDYGSNYITIIRDGGDLVIIQGKPAISPIKYISFKRLESRLFDEVESSNNYSSENKDKLSEVSIDNKYNPGDSVFILEYEEATRQADKKLIKILRRIDDLEYIVNHNLELKGKGRG